MARIYSQKYPDVWDYSASLVASASIISASIPCAGYDSVLGFVRSDAVSETSSGIRILQSTKKGGNFYETSASQVAASTAQGFEFPIFGYAVKVEFRNGAADASGLDMLWQLKPIS